MHRPLTPASRRAAVRHVLMSLAVAAVVCGLLALGMVMAAHREAEDHAERIARQVAAAVAVPLSRHDFASGDLAHDEIRRDLAPFLDSRMVARVKVWIIRENRAVIAYSDERRLVGESHPVGSAGPPKLDPGDAHVQRVPRDSEHRFEAASSDTLLEAFVEIREAGGQPARLELYVPTDTRGEAERTARAVLPLLLGGLGLLALTTLPLSVGLARRLERERAEQRAARRYGLASAESTRLELARHLHNGVLPDISGARMLLELARSGDSGVSSGELVDRALRLLEGDVRELRAILNGLVPAYIDGPPELEALVARLRREAGDSAPPVTVHVSAGPALGREVAVLLHWITEELVRNALRHAAADRIRVQLLGATEHGTRLTVSDDGIGLPVDRISGGVGLHLARRVLEDHGGRMSISPGASGGTTIEVVLPPPESARRFQPGRRTASLGRLGARLSGRRIGGAAGGASRAGDRAGAAGRSG